VGFSRGVVAARGTKEKEGARERRRESDEVL
jgi:hypothetical protein